MNATAISTENNSGMSYATLIPVRLGELGGEVVQICNARDLHICLGVGRRFASWIVERIAEYGFVEGSDFASRNGEAKKGVRGGHNRKEYDLSVDMAKELAMVERTEAGRRIRRYFIDCEKRLRQIAPESAAEALRKALSPEQQHTLSGKVHGKVACLEKARQRAGYCELWSSLKAKHQVARYQDISQGEFDEACSFVDSYSFEGEWIGKPSKGGKYGDFNVDWYSAQDVVHLLHHVDWVMYRWHQGIADGVKALNPKLYSSTFEHFREVKITAQRLESRLSDMVGYFKKENGGLRPAECVARGIAA